MFFQKIVKGITGIDTRTARKILLKEGIQCSWWRKVGTISPADWQSRLNERNLEWHLNRFEDADPAEKGEPFARHTPFISATAGAVERDIAAQDNILFPAELIAASFATNAFQQNGFVFYGYVYTLGRRSLKLIDFAEEVRDLLVYTAFLPFHHEGEVVAKIHIPSIQLEKYEPWHCTSKGRIRRGKAIKNPDYEPPERYANVREILGRRER
jgi:hypothetical protein